MSAVTARRAQEGEAELTLDLDEETYLDLVTRGEARAYKRELRDEREREAIKAHAQKMADEAPPLSQETINRVAALLRPFPKTT